MHEDVDISEEQHVEYNAKDEDEEERPLISEDEGPKGIGGTPFASRVSDCAAAHQRSDNSSSTWSCPGD